MLGILLYIWQLPQNILGLLVILFTRAKKKNYNDIFYWKTSKYMNMGVSLGNYIIFGANPSYDNVYHEYGHQKQSKYLGILYLLIIGLPSISFNIWDKLFHKEWEYDKRYIWYYNLFWEKWADKLGGVNRNEPKQSSVINSKDDLDKIKEIVKDAIHNVSNNI